MPGKFEWIAYVWPLNLAIFFTEATGIVSDSLSMTVCSSYALWVFWLKILKISIWPFWCVTVIWIFEHPWIGKWYFTTELGQAWFKIALISLSEIIFSWFDFSHSFFKHHFFLRKFMYYSAICIIIRDYLLLGSIFNTLVDFSSLCDIGGLALI